MLRTIAIICLFAFSCEEAELRERARPSGEDADNPGFEAETIETVTAAIAAAITIGKTIISIPEGGLGEDAEVRLRTLKSKPDREGVAYLGDAKGDIIELTMYNKNTKEIYASSVLDQPYAARQVLTDVSDEGNLKYVVISAPGTDDELVQVLSRKAITTSAALTASGLSVSIELGVTHVIFYAVESAETSSSVIILDSGKDTSNDSGGSVSTSSTSSSSTSSSSSSSGGSGIDCSGKGSDPENEEWIPVPANAEVGQSEDFCVMKFEAKNLSDGSGKPVSIKTGTPWVWINQPSAIVACASLGSSYELITNEAWQTIARNIETAQSPPGTYLNWSGGSIAGSSALNRGHSDNNPTESCDGTNENVGGSCSPDSNAPHSQKRTHTLSNGEVIWDFSGNVWEWTSSTFAAQGTDWYISQNPASVPDTAAGKLRWGPEGDYIAKGLPEYGGLGHGFLSLTGGTNIRGGYWNSDLGAGAFSANLATTDQITLNYYGFRCISSGDP